MERAELTAGSIEVRGSGAIHRVLSFLGEFFLGIGTEARREGAAENWWDREPSAPRAESAPMVLREQAELFDAAGQAAYVPAPRAELPVAAAPAAKPAPAARTVVSVHSRSRTTARVVATTRVAAAPRVAAVSKTEATGRGAVGRQLVASRSISSGREESRWFSVPQRVLLPRFQLFEGAEAVTEGPEGLRIGSPALRAQRGRVWFV